MTKRSSGRATALRYRGTHYKFGGTTKRGLDCSGLVSRVWDDLKLKKIPRVSSALYNSGKPVPSTISAQETSSFQENL